MTAREKMALLESGLADGKPPFRVWSNGLEVGVFDSAAVAAWGAGNYLGLVRVVDALGHEVSVDFRGAKGTGRARRRL
jgi:hypothetical protein